MSTKNKGFLSVAGNANITRININEKNGSFFGFVKLVIKDDGVDQHFDARVGGADAKMIKMWMNPGDQLVINSAKLIQGEAAKNDKNFSVNVSLIKIVSCEAGRLTARSQEQASNARQARAQARANQQAQAPAPQQQAEYVAPQAQAPAPQAQAQAPAPQQEPKVPTNTMDFDDDIPF